MSREKTLAPEEDATANGLAEPLPWTLKVTVDDVALIPATVPLSRSVDVPSVVAERNRVA